jgi:competence protein ComEA
VDLNRDSASRLLLLPGIGPGRAGAIERDRREHGPYERLDQVDRVPGIGPATVEGIRRVRGLDPVTSGPSEDAGFRAHEDPAR